MQLTDTWRAQYTHQFASMAVSAAKAAAAEAVAHKINDHKSAYEAISARVNGVPWYLIGCLHSREASLDFNAFLGDGEPLNRATVNVPAHMGPFTGPNAFADGAVAALVHEGFDKVTDWSLGSILYHAEEYNGEGYHNHHPPEPSPYVFAGTSIYVCGKFDRDGHFNPSLVDQQLGVAIILWAMQKLGFIQFPQSSPSADSAPLLPVQGSTPNKPSTGGGSIIMSSLLFKMGAQWALDRLGEGTTYVGFWAWYHINVDALLNPHLETAITNVFLALAGVAAIATKEGWHRQTA